jgi:hypothetical protein
MIFQNSILRCFFRWETYNHLNLNKPKKKKLIQKFLIRNIKFSATKHRLQDNNKERMKRNNLSTSKLRKVVVAWILETLGHN